MPAISNQFYGTSAANAISSMQSTMPSKQGQFRPIQSLQGNPPYSVELSNAAMQEQEVQPQKESIAPELLNALNNDVTRTQGEMSRAISDNHLHIQGMFSDDATSSFNFFGVSMPLAASSFEFPKIQVPSADTRGAESSADTGSTKIAPAAEANTNGNINAAASTVAKTEVPSSTATSSTDRIVPQQREIAKSAQENVTKQADGFSAQLSGMAMAATASPAGATALQR